MTDDKEARNRIRKMIVKEARKAADKLDIKDKEIAKAVCWELISYQLSNGDEGSTLYRLGLKLYFYIEEYGFSSKDFELEEEDIAYEKFLNDPDCINRPDFLLTFANLLLQYKEKSLAHRSGVKLLDYIKKVG